MKKKPAKMTAAQYMQMKHPVPAQTNDFPGRKRRVNKPSKPLLNGYSGNYRFVIGIDPGYRIDRQNTGLSVHTEPTQIREIGNYFAWQAINRLQEYLQDFGASEMAVVIEDPKTWTQFATTSDEAANNRKASKGGLQAIFNQFYTFCRVNKIDCYPVSVQVEKIYDEGMFRKIFGWEGWEMPPKDAMAAASFCLGANIYK